MKELFNKVLNTITYPFEAIAVIMDESKRMWEKEADCEKCKDKSR